LIAKYDLKFAVSGYLITAKISFIAAQIFCHCSIPLNNRRAAAQALP
jgi:hypothetical protein